MSGEVKVMVKEYKTEIGRVEDTFVNQLRNRDYFGEIAMLTDSYRTASVVALNYCTLGKLSLESMHSLTVNFPKFKEVLYN
jgi:CRP-like cAMP-binding protein